MMLKSISDVYEIEGKIGAGNSGEIYKAYHKNLGKEVVLKKIKAEIKDIVNNRAEVDVLKNLRHSCLPQVLDFLEIDGNVYTVMDYIPGNSFKQYLDAGTVFEEKSVRIWAKQICTTLCYLHSQKPPIIHSDLKPGNIMLMPNGNICLIDFNISASLDGDSAWVTGFTSGYAAPEQIQALKYNRNELNHALWKKIDARADIYSFGATIYHLLCGKKPQTDENGFAEDIRDMGIMITDVFAEIIMKCLEPDPAKRYQNAENLLDDLKNISKKDKRYKALAIKQKIGYLSVMICMLFFGVMTVTGYFRMDTDKQKEYEKLVRQEAQCIQDGEYEYFETYYQKAISLDTGRLEAYYQKALALNNQRRYGDTIDFINSEILSNNEVLSEGEALNNVYYLLGNAYEKQEDYQQAALCYERAIEIKPDNSDYYRDYAIVLAYAGNPEKAQEILQTAKENGLDSVEVNYIEGEIIYSLGQYGKAKEFFMECINNAPDDDMKMRAYIMAAKCISGEADTIEGKNEEIELLEKARKQLPQEMNIGVLELLAQTYSDLGNELGDSSYYKKAISVFEQIKTQGMGDYETEYNLAVLYQNIQEYGKAIEILKQILDEYGENYKTYKALAFLEIGRQSNTVAEQRNYYSFDEYYHKADKLYKEQLMNNVNDIEMERLEELHEQAIYNNWITE